MGLREELLTEQKKAIEHNRTERMKRIDEAGKEIGECLKRMINENPERKSFIFRITSGIIKDGYKILAYDSELDDLVEWMSSRGINMSYRYDPETHSGTVEFTIKSDREKIHNKILNDLKIALDAIDESDFDRVLDGFENLWSGDAK